MNSEFNELNRAIRCIYDITTPFEKSIKNIEDILNSNILSEDYIKKLCVTKVLLQNIIDKESEPLSVYREKLKQLKENCNHNFVYVGHDSHHDFYECTKCGETCKD